MKRFYRYFGQVVTIGTIFVVSLGLFGCGGTAPTESRPVAAPSIKSTAQAPAGGLIDANQPSVDRKVIETAQMTIEAKDLAVTETKTFELLANRQGKMDSSNVTLDSNGRKNGVYLLRVPAGQLREYVRELAAIPDIVVRQRSLAVKDVTEEYIDISARLENMQRHEIRLREILTKANTIEEILKVEKELAAARGQIESATARIKALSDKIDFSTISLRITEVTVMTETNFSGKLMAIIRDSWVSAGDVVLYLVATVIILSPLAMLVALIVWFWRKRRRNQTPKNTQSNQSE